MLGQAADAVSETRQLAELTLEEIGRLSRGVHPSVLDHLGLRAALQHLTEEYAKAHGIHVDISTQEIDPTHLPRDVALSIYRIAQEALTNVAKHADASMVTLVVHRNQNSLRMIVEDNGCGFDVASVMDLRPDGSLGVVGMQERVKLLNGSIRIESEQGAGTTVVADIPLTEVDYG